MTVTAKRRIYNEYHELVRARDKIGTVERLARRNGVSRQRLHQIVREVETGHYADRTSPRQTGEA
ncbi:MAG: hypothetical protein IH945_01665 [Armatimonadetes bacterium]|nr:hypothetical protein [Armatimonadota bacterium]